MKKEVTPDVWKKLMVLGGKQGAIKLNDLAQEMRLGPEETLIFLRQIFPEGVGAEVYHKENECWIDIKSEAIQYMLPLSPGEWMELFQMLDEHRGAESAAIYSLKRKVTENGPIKVVMDLLNQLESWDQELSASHQTMINQLDEVIGQQKMIQLLTSEDRAYSLFPYKVLHLEGTLSLIAEDSVDHCLFVVPLNEIGSFSILETLSQPRVTAYEIEEFITAIRAMNEKETRLILKIHEPHSTNLFPDHQFLGKPCMITNPTGDLIWAAYVEPCAALYDWLFNLGNRVEILDPVNFKEDYLIYCEEKLRKIA